MASKPEFTPKTQSRDLSLTQDDYSTFERQLHRTTSALTLDLCKETMSQPTMIP
jgi:hypothetical protein